MKKVISILIVLAIVLSVIPLSAFATADTKEELTAVGKETAEVINDEGIVLMKNKNNALPLANGSSVAVFGEAQSFWLYGDTSFDTEAASANVNTLTYQHGYIPWGAGSSRSTGVGKLGDIHIDPIDALRAVEAEGRLDVYDELSDAYISALESSNFPTNYTEYIPDEAMYDAASAAADTAIVFLRRWDGECVDMNSTVNGIALPTWELTDTERTLLQNVSAKFDKVIVLLNTPGPIDTDWSIDGNDLGIDVDALLFIGYGGIQGGLSVANVLMGDVNPSGKLVDTWAKDIYDYPTTESFLNDTSVQKYTEDIYLGYKYFETFNIPVNYEFGFGLSYTGFETTVKSFTATDEAVTIEATVKNTGARQGKEVVEVYVEAPQGVLGKPSKVLCAFDKTSLLSPGETEALTLTIKMSDLASYDDTGKTAYKSAYVLEAGDYNFYVGNSVKEADDRLAGTKTVAELTLVEQLSEQCPTNLEKRLLADGTFEILNDENAVETLEEALTVEAEKWYSIIPKASYSTFTGKYETVSSSLLYNDDTGEWEKYKATMLCDTYKLTDAIYEINVAEAGEYKLSVRAATNNTTAATLTFSYSTDLEGYTAMTTASVTDTYTASGSRYYGFKDVNGAGAFDLPAGKVYIKITQSGNPNIDSFTVTTTDALLDSDTPAVIEAEDYSAITSASSLTASDITEATTTGKLYNASTGEWDAYSCKSLVNGWKGYTASYTVYVREAGYYTVKARLADNKNGAVPGAIFKNSSGALLWNITGEKTSTESGSSYHGYKDYTTTDATWFEEGKNTVVVQLVNSGNLDRFTILATDATIPVLGTRTYSAGSYTTLYAENGSDFTYSSGGYLDNMYRTGNYVEYIVEAPYTGTYTFTLGSATRRDTDSVAITSTVDGINYTEPVNILTPNNGSWSTFTDNGTGTITLQKGKNILRITSVCAPNIGYFKLTADLKMTYLAGEQYEYGDSSSTYDVVIEDIASDGVLYKDGEWVSYSGKNFGNMFIGTGYVTFLVETDIAGTYNLKVRASVNSTDVKQITYKTSYDNVTYSDAVSVAVSYTGASGLGGTSRYNNYYDFDGGTVTLKKGKNLIKFLGGCSYNLGGFSLELAETAADQTENTIIEPSEKSSYYQLADVVNGVCTMDEFVAQMTSSELCSFFVSYGNPNFGGSAAVREKYGISGAVFSDGPSGLSGNASAFPCETIVASTWNTDLAEALGKIVGAEAYYNNVDVWAAPAMNLHRNPYEGRNSEYYSEDTFITSQMGLATVEGANTYGLVAILKHFVLNEKEKNKLSCDSSVSERALRELYLKPFEVCIKEGNARGIMSSYNLINGEAVTEKYDLLTNILRNEWGYEYYISGDWNNTKDMVSEVNAGNGVREPAGFCDVSVLIEAVQNGEITRETLEKGAKYELNTLKEITHFLKDHDEDICNGNHNFVDGVCEKCKMADRSVNVTLSIAPVIADEYETYIYGANLELGATLTLNYYVNLTAENAGAQMTFTRGDSSVTVDAVFDEATSLYKYAYTGITPQCMTDTVTATLKNGETVLEVKEYSVLEYCEKLYPDADDELKSLLSALLSYGAASQTLVDYNAGKLATGTTKITFPSPSASMPDGVADMTITPKQDDNNKVCGAGVILGNAIQLYFRVEIEDGATLYLNGNEVEYTAEKNGKYVYTDFLNATQLDDEFVLTVKDGNTTLHSVRYSVNTYLKNKWNAENTKLRAVVRALNEYATASAGYLA